MFNLLALYLNHRTKVMKNFKFYDLKWIEFSKSILFKNKAPITFVMSAFTIPFKQLFLY
jgi:hypothetical protein